MYDQSTQRQLELSTVLKKTFVEDVLYFEQTDSTNTQALQLISTKSPLQTPHLIYAESQTQGRGRGGNQWWSSTGSLTFSLVVDCEKLGLSISQQMQLPLLAGIAVLRSAKGLLTDGLLALKWPNDVYLDGRKLAGILTEAPLVPQDEQASPRYVVIGVGINVKNQLDAGPNSLRATGISLAELSDKNLDRVEILTSFLRHLEQLIQELQQGVPVLEEWSAACLLNGKVVAIEVAGTEVCGTCQGIDSTGALLLQTEKGEKRFIGGVVKSWK